MEESKNEPGSDAAVANLAKKIAEEKPMQAGKFSGAAAKAAEAVVNGRTEEKAPSGLTFDEVLIGIKAGKSAYRKIWTSTAGTIALKLSPAFEGGNVTGMVFDRDGLISRAGLHNDDMLASDWIVL